MWKFKHILSTVSLDPPLPVYLINVVSGLRDKSAKGYPVKKVRLAPFLVRIMRSNYNQLLLVLWKTLLACCGGIRELARAKKLAREIAMLPTTSDEGLSSPVFLKTY
jgi:N1221-like protein